MAGKKTRQAEKTADQRRREALEALLLEVVFWKEHVSLRGVDYRLAKKIDEYRSAVKACDDEHG
jgi:hypothetical protein